MSIHQIVAAVLLAAGAILGQIVWDSEPLLAAAPIQLAELQIEDAPLCRFGVNVNVEADLPHIDELDIDPLRIGWYIDYSAVTTPLRPNGIEHAVTIRVSDSGYTPSGQRLLDVVDANPGAIYFAGNEPDRPLIAGDPSPDYDNVQPEIYARRYHEIYSVVKARDPSAQIFAGSIVQATELRLRYLDRVLAAYFDLYGEAMPVDGWSIHGFILNEVTCDVDRNPDGIPCWGAEVPPGLDDVSGMRIDAQDNDNFDIFKTQIERFRGWMAARGYRNYPLYLSEFGVLMPKNQPFDPPFDEGRVNAFMDKTLNYILSTSSGSVGYPLDGNRLVQRFSWYSTTDTGFNGNLFEPTGAHLRTLMGDNFAANAQAVEGDVDFYPQKLQSSPASPPAGGGSATLSLSAPVANAGNLLATSDVVVRFYNGDPDGGGTQIGDDVLLSLRGCGDHALAQVEWSDVAPGLYSIYVKIFDENGVDINPANDTASALLFFSSSRIFLPLSSVFGVP